MATTTNTRHVVLTGATGRTGGAVAASLALGEWPGVALVGAVARGIDGSQLPESIARATSLAAIDLDFDVLVDFTTAAAVEDNLALALAADAHVVLGTTGVDASTLEAWGARFAERNLELLYAPNCALGALLMMRWAGEAAHYFGHASIIETHHVAKLDAPSGTARRTSEIVHGVWQQSDERAVAPVVHSNRLPGAVAHQDVIFGGPGELLTIRHDATDRGCYAAGVALAVSRVGERPGLTIGLENLL